MFLHTARCGDAGDPWLRARRDAPRTPASSPKAASRREGRLVLSQRWFADTLIGPPPQRPSPEQPARRSLPYPGRTGRQLSVTRKGGPPAPQSKSVAPASRLVAQIAPSVAFEPEVRFRLQDRHRS